MSIKNTRQGFAIALAWPATECKQAGAWYDIPAYYLGLNKQGYYRVGHAAIVLVDSLTQKCCYFDFGRYHAPYGYGRVRCVATDHDLAIHTKAQFDDEAKGIANVREILQELYPNPSTHGSGTIYGAVTKVDFEQAFDFAQTLQDKEFLPYGPFVYKGTNCSRFVNSVLLAGKPSLFQKISLTLPLTVTPTPMWNLYALGTKIDRIGEIEAISLTNHMLEQETNIATT